MALILCMLRNAADNINGVDFVPHAEGMISAEHVSAEHAARFAKIPGYKVIEDETSDKPAVVAAAAPAAVDAAPAAVDTAPADDGAAAAPAADAAGAEVVAAAETTESADAETKPKATAKKRS